MDFPFISSLSLSLYHSTYCIPPTESHSQMSNFPLRKEGRKREKEIYALRLSDTYMLVHSAAVHNMSKATLHYKMAIEAEKVSE